jgi:hypothetical protein
MRGQAQARAARLPTAVPRSRWSSWIRLTLERRRQVRQERLEWVERLQREQRRARQSGERLPERQWDLLRR